MAYTLLSHAVGGGTTSAMNTTGATLIVLVISIGSASTPAPGTISDSAGNTKWFLTSNWSNDAANITWMAFCYNPVTSATHTFTQSTGSFRALAALAFSGPPGPVDFNVSAIKSGSFVSLPTVTPSSNGALLVSGCAGNSGSTLTVDSGFTITDQTGGGATELIGAAYLIQSTAAAVSLKWGSLPGNVSSQLLVFEPGVSGGSGGVTAFGFTG